MATAREKTWRNPVAIKPDRKEKHRRVVRVSLRQGDGHEKGPVVDVFKRRFLSL